MTDRPPVLALGAQPLADIVDAAATKLAAGEVLVLPTDTVYGLVALPGQPAATDRIFALKGRRADVPLAVLCADAQQALALASPAGDEAIAALTDRWWPGPLTLVLPRRPGTSLHLGEPGSTIGLRVPDHDLVRALARRVGPVAATSANRHGHPTPATARAAAGELGGGVALVVDGGTLEARASTVVDATRRPWRILRDGPLPVADILELGAMADGGEADDGA